MTQVQSKIPVELGDLVKLKQQWLFMNDKSKLQPCIGIVSAIRDGAGMPESVSYASVIWENGNYTEHYISDLERIER